jgi:hypothetical protein
MPPAPSTSKLPGAGFRSLGGRRSVRYVPTCGSSKTARKAPEWLIDPATSCQNQLSAHSLLRSLGFLLQSDWFWRTETKPAAAEPAPPLLRCNSLFPTATGHWARNLENAFQVASDTRMPPPPAASFTLACRPRCLPLPEWCQRQGDSGDNPTGQFRVSSSSGESLALPKRRRTAADGGYWP